MSIRYLGLNNGDTGDTAEAVLQVSKIDWRLSRRSMYADQRSGSGKTAHAKSVDGGRGLCIKLLALAPDYDDSNKGVVAYSQQAGTFPFCSSDCPPFSLG